MAGLGVCVSLLWAFEEPPDFISRTSASSSVENFIEEEEDDDDDEVTIEDSVESI